MWLQGTPNDKDSYVADPGAAYYAFQAPSTLETQTLQAMGRVGIVLGAIRWLFFKDYLNGLHLCIFIEHGSFLRIALLNPSGHGELRNTMGRDDRL